MRVWAAVLLVGTLRLWMANSAFVPLTFFQPCISRPNSLQVASRQLGPSWPSTCLARSSRIRASVPGVGFMTMFAKWYGRRSAWCGSDWPKGSITRLNVWLDGGMTVGLRGAGDSCVGHGGMLGISILEGAGAYGVLGGGEEVDTLIGGGALGSGTLGGGAGEPDQRVVGGVVGVTGVGTGRSKCMIFDNCISAFICSFPNFADCEAGCGCLRAAMSSWIERVMFLCGERPGITWSCENNRTVSPWRTRRVLGHQM